MNNHHQELRKEILNGNGKKAIYNHVINARKEKERTRIVQNVNIKNVWGKTFDEIFEKHYNIEYEVSHYTEHKRLIETGHNEDEAKTAAHDKAHDLAVRIAGEKACNAADAALSEYYKDNGEEKMFNPNNLSITNEQVNAFVDIMKAPKD